MNLMHKFSKEEGDMHLEFHKKIEDDNNKE
jgi:hypothetical protein